MGVFDKPWTAACATWFRLKLLLGIGTCTAVISIAFSSWQTQGNEGDFKVVADAIPNFKWWDSVCDATPYQYLSPFKFTFNLAGKSYDNPAYCPWPLGNTTFRLIVGCLYLVFGISLYWDTAFTRVFASPLLFLFALLWYSSFVVDAQSLTASTEACTNGFGDGTISSIKGLTIICNNTHYGITVAIDLILFFLVFVIWRAWGHCPNRHNKDTLASSSEGISGDEIPDKTGLKRGSISSSSPFGSAPTRV